MLYTLYISALDGTSSHAKLKISCRQACRCKSGRADHIILDEIFQDIRVYNSIVEFGPFKTATTERNRLDPYMEGLAQLVRARKRYWFDFSLHTTRRCIRIGYFALKARGHWFKPNSLPSSSYILSPFQFSEWSPTGLHTLHTLFFIFVFILFICKEKIDLFNNNILQEVKL